MKGKRREWESASMASEHRALEALKRRERRRWRASGRAAPLASLAAPPHRARAQQPTPQPLLSRPPADGPAPSGSLCAGALGASDPVYSGGVGPLSGCGAAMQHIMTP
jgi:hypothetical protein